MKELISEDDWFPDKGNASMNPRSRKIPLADIEKNMHSAEFYCDCWHSNKIVQLMTVNSM